MTTEEPEEDELILGDEAIQSDGDAVEAPAGEMNEGTASEPAPRVATSGGTLFERMSNLTRSSKATDEDEDAEQSRDPLDIPRFLNRQNNQ